MIQAGAEHAVLMAAVHEIAFPAAAWPAAELAVLLGQPGVVGLVDGGEDETAGMLLLRVAADEAEILTIGVTQPRQGMGRRLIRAAVEAARAKGATVMFLEVAAGNAAARRLYEALGFAPAGLRRRYYEDGDDAVVLKLVL